MAKFVRASADCASEHTNDDNTVNITQSSSNPSTGSTNDDNDVGLRFANVVVPQSATIRRAWIEIYVTAYENSNGKRVDWKGEDVDDAAAFTDTDGDVTDRTLTTAEDSLHENPYVDDSGARYCATEVTAIVQEIVNRTAGGGWASGNAMAFIGNAVGSNVISYQTDHGANAPQLIIIYDDDADTERDPTATADNGNPFTNPTNAYSSNDSDATWLGNDAAFSQQYYEFGIPDLSGSTIDDIVIKLEAASGGTNDNYKLGYELSWDGGTSWTTIKYTPQFTNADRVVYLGGRHDGYSHTFIPDDLTTANFRVRISSPTDSDDNLWHLDHVAVQVFYSSGVEAKSITKDLQYAVVADDSVTKSLKYTVIATPTAKTKSLEYVVVLRTAIQKSLQYLVVAAAAAITKSLKYTVVEAPSALTKSLKYTVVATPSAPTKSLQYLVVAPVSPVTKSLKYTVVATPTAPTKSLKYVVVTTPSAITKALQYEVQLATQEVIEKTLQYTVIEVNSATKSLTYIVVSPQSVTKSLKYTVATTPSAITKSLKYTVIIVPSALTKSLKYTVIETPSALTKSLQYSVLSAVAITKTLQYEVVSSQSITRGLEYHVMIPASVTKSLHYEIIASVAIAKTLLYTVISEVAAITKSLQYEVSTADTFAVTKTLAYAVVSQVAVTKSLSYALVAETAITKTLQYELRVTGNFTRRDDYFPL